MNLNHWAKAFWVSFVCLAPAFHYMWRRAPSWISKYNFLGVAGRVRVGQLLSWILRDRMVRGKAGGRCIVCNKERPELYREKGHRGGRQWGKSLVIGYSSWCMCESDCLFLLLSNGNMLKGLADNWSWTCTCYSRCFESLSDFKTKGYYSKV